MSTYGRRSSQRRVAADLDQESENFRRAAKRPAIASSSSSRLRSQPQAAQRPSSEDEAEESQIKPTIHADGTDDEGGVSDDADEEEEEELKLLPYPKLPINDANKKAAEAMGEEEILRKASEVVRYALACEYQKIPIRKDDVRKVVLDGTTKGFAVIFNKAQKLLHKTFGFHMVEVRKTGADNIEIARQTETLLREAASQANGLRPRNRARGEEESDGPGPESGRIPTDIYVLRSSLPSKVTKALVQATEQLTRAQDSSESQGISSSQQQQQRRRGTQPSPESALNWSSADKQGGEMGLLYVILGLILVSGRTISDYTLHSHLGRLGLQPQDALPSKLRGTGAASGSVNSGTQGTQTQARARAAQNTLDGFLASMVKQSYLEKQRSDVVAAENAQGGGPSSSTQSNRRRSRIGGRAGIDDESTVWEWRWGSRAEVEIGEKRIAQMMAEIFLDPVASNDLPQTEAGEDEEEQTRRIDRARRKENRKLLLENIASVAGSQLVD